MNNMVRQWCKLAQHHTMSLRAAGGVPQYPRVRLVDADVTVEGVLLTFENLTVVEGAPIQVRVRMAQARAMNCFELLVDGIPKQVVDRMNNDNSEVAHMEAVQGTEDERRRSWMWELRILP